MPRYLVTTMPAGEFVDAIVATDPVAAATQAETSLGGNGSHGFRLASPSEVDCDEGGGGYVAQVILDHIDIEPVRKSMTNYRSWLRAHPGIPSWVLRVPVTTH